MAAPTPNDQNANQGEQGPPPVAISAANPMEQFRFDVQKALQARFAAKYPELQKYLAVEELQRQPGYQDFLFRFLDDAEKGDREQQAAMLLAGDFLADGLWCPGEDERAHRCEAIHKAFADHKLTLQLDELGGGSYYQHDLLWRLWRDYSDTDSGERAFVLLLDRGWDTSNTCAKGADQFREVIKQGEAFLQQRSASAYRPFVLDLTGEAYATWWTLSHGPSAGLEDYVDPKQYQEGADEARTKAISYFEQVQQAAPQTELASYATEMISALKQKLPIKEYRFFCIYD
jgi:hypothetical protein